MHAVMGSGRLIAGRYRLQGPLGRGAMGIVWRGRDELLARDVAVKEVQISALSTPANAETMYQRTLREARTAARLKHPSVVTVFDVVEESGTPWIVMELVEARSLDRVISEDGPLPPLQAAELGASLISALATAHSAGVLHRDVKPSNVLVTDEGRAVLTDFGIATFAEDPSMTQAGMVVGTPGFTAPERVRGDVATPASDLWSLGATLYAAVEGRGPFERGGGSSVITAGVAVEDAPRAPSAGPLGPVIDALLSRDPGTRPDVITATRLLDEAVTEARTGSRPSLGAGGDLAEAGTVERPAADSAAPAADHGSAEQQAAFLDPPVFAALSMPDLPGQPAAAEMAYATPGSAVEHAAGELTDAAGDDPGQPGYGDTVGTGPVLWEPVPPARPSGPAGAGGFLAGFGGLGGPSGPGGSGGGPAGPGGSGGGPGGSGGGPGGPGGLRFWRRGGPFRPSSGSWRLMVAGAGIAAIVVAAVVAWSIYTHTGSAQALQNSTLPTGAVTGTGQGRAGPGASGPASGSHTGGTSSPGTQAGTTASHGKTPAGQPGGKAGSPGPSGSTGPSPSPSLSPSPSSSPSPSPSPTPTGPVLPAGYLWHHFSAAVMHSTAGFKIGVPALWTQSVSGQVAHLNQPVRNFHLTVGLSLWTYVKPLAQAQYLSGLDADSHHGFTRLELTAIGFKQAGGAISASAAELKFSWTNTSGGKFTEIVLLVTLSTKSGVQPYTFTLWAPASSYSAAYGVFHTALGTFRPLPG